MRKIYIALLSFFLFFIVSPTLNAQVNSYVFATTTTGTLEDMSAGTTQLIGTGSDDGTSAVTNIGFSFSFNGIPYTQFSASANGLVRLGATAVVNQWNNLSTTDGFLTGASQPKLAPYFDDLATGTTGKVHYKLVGAAPNRKLVIEWIVTVPWANGSAANATFQTWLEETTNRVTFVYGAGMVVNSANGGYTIGIGSSAIDYQSVTSAANTASISAHNGTQSDAIANGRTYSFTPPPPCVPGSLTGGTTASTVTAACASASFTLSISGASSGSGLIYVWQTSPDGVAWTDVVGQTGPTYTVTQTTATYYRRKMTCTGTDAFSSALQITQNSIANCYCDVVFPSDTEPITLVSFANINNTSSPTINGSPDLEDFTSIVGNVSKGITYPIAVKGNTGGAFTTHINVFIDWNQDGDFVDAGENYYLGTIVGSTGTDAIQATGNILIPPTALDGTTKMRVIKKYNAQATSCNTTGFGQAEDYLLNITTPTCLVPSAISVGSITTTGASVTFTGTGTVYVEYGPPGFTPGTTAAPGVGGTVVSGPTPVALAGLTPNTLYDVYVRQDCGGGVFSGNGNGGNFRTLCNTITTFPFTETFEAGSVSRPCWIPTAVSGTVAWTYGAGAGNGGTITAAHGGTANAQYFGAGTGSVGRLVSPALNLSAMPPALGAQLTFWYANQNWLGDQNQLRVYYKTSAAGTWTLIPGAVYTTNVGAWTEVELMLPSSTSSDYYIAFEGTELFGWGVAVDDVTIAAAPSCPKPTLVSAVGTTSSSISVSFTSPGNLFVVEYGATGFIPGTGNTAGGGTVQLGGASPIELTGLAANTAFDIYVRRVCDPGVDYSVNVKTTAATLCAATSVPFLQNFETSVPMTGLPTCVSMEDVNGNSGPDPNLSGGRWTTFAGTSNQTYVSPTMVARYLYDAQNLTRGADDWIYMQGLNLTGGTSYRLKFFYKGSDGPTWTERLEVAYGTKAFNADQTNVIYTNNNIATALANPWDSAIVDFTPATTDVYYIGFHATSLPDQAFLYLDDVSVKVTPLVDVGVTTAAGIPTCPAATGVLQATIRNYNTTPQNFATYPVTVTATITGAATGTLTTTINTGTLAAGATLNQALPAFNFVSGLYNVTITTSSANDPETGNDSYTTSFFVNASPVAPIVAAAAICEGGPSVLLSSQFVTPPPAPVTAPAVSSGAITVAVPDNTPAGTSHTLAVSGIPAGATITGISVNVNMTHTWINDIAINLRAPNGKILNLFNRNGDFFQENITNMTVNSTSTTPIPVTGAPFTGTFAPDAGSGVGPTGSLSNASSFADLYAAANGNWTLSLRDHVAFDDGTLTSWSITITYGFPHPNVTWAPTTGLFTNAAATLGYFGENANSVYAKPIGTTTYTVTSTNPATGCKSSSTAVVTVNPKPVVNATLTGGKICLSDTLVALNATPAGGTWSGIGVLGSGFRPYLTALGTYNLLYTYSDPLGCVTVDTVAAKVEDCPERLILLRDNAVILFPNPNNGQFNVRINSILYNKLTMRVFSNSGALVRTQVYSGLVFNRIINVNLTHLPSGPYMVQFSYDGGVRTSEKTFKVMVAR